MAWRTGMFDVANRCKLKHTKKLRKTKQQIITLIRIKTYWDFSGFQGAIYQQCHMGLFSRRKHQLVPKASCDDPKPSPSFCLPIVATVAKGVAHFIWLPRPPAPVGVLYIYVCQSAAKGSVRKIKVISTTQKSIQILYIIQKNPPKKLLKKMGVARDCHAHCRDGD